MSNVRPCRNFHKALAERREGEIQSLEKGLQKQVADTSRRNASWGQKELALSADHVSLLALHPSFVGLFQTNWIFLRHMPLEGPPELDGRLQTGFQLNGHLPTCCFWACGAHAFWP